MTQKASGRACRQEISLKKLMAMLPNNDKAREWFEARIWPRGLHCSRCGSSNVQRPTTHRSTMH